MLRVCVLAGLQLDAKQYDEAAKSLDAIKSPDFEALEGGPAR